MPNKSNKFVISLDEMDLGLLPTSYMRDYGGAAPLWTRSAGARSDHYYEFEIRNESDYKMDHVICHICAVDVPGGFFKQHLDSDKHNLNVKIADIAMERVKRSYHNNTSERETDPTDYLCTSCVTVVKKTERFKHERSLVHRNSVIVDKFLHDFYILYKNSVDDCADDSDGGVIDETQCVDIKEVDKISVNENNNNDISLISDFTCTEVSDSNNSELAKHNDTINDSDPTADVIKSPIKENTIETKIQEIQSNNENVQDTINQSAIEQKKSDDEVKYNKTFYPNFTNNEITKDTEEECNRNSEIYNENGSLHYHLSDNKYFLTCVVCKVNLDYDEDVIVNHLESLDHLDKYNDILLEQFLVCKDRFTCCQLCDVQFEKEKELTHCNEIGHITRHELHKRWLLRWD